MDKEIVSEHRPAEIRPDEAASRGGRFHPVVYKVLAGLVAWFVIASWLFAGGGRTDLLLVMASGLILVMGGVPALLGLTRRTARRRRGASAERIGFGDWASREVQIWSGPIKGLSATVETIVPIAAVAIGMTVFGIVLHFVVR